MKRQIVPDDVVVGLQKLHDKKKLTEEEKLILDTFLESLEEALPNPVCPSKILVNPIPNEMDVTINQEKSLEDRIKHINTVNARIMAANQPQDPAELENFDLVDDSFDLLPKSIFEVADHELAPTVPEVLEPTIDMTAPNPDIPVSEVQPDQPVEQPPATNP